MKKTFKLLEKIEEGVAELFFVAGSAIAVFGVFMRYVLNSPVTWTTELFELFMVIAIFIGFGMALKDDQHIVVDLIYDKLSSNVKKIMDIVSNLFGFGFSAYLTYMGFLIVKITYIQGGVTVDVGIPIWLTYAIMPVGMGLLSIYFILRVIKSIFNKLEYADSKDIENIINKM